MDKNEVLVIDAKDHLLGRLASVVAKKLLSGERVVVVRCEEINVSGSYDRTKLKYKAFLRKRCLVNPKKGPFHFRTPSKMFWRTVRGMIPYKTSRGAEALKRLVPVDGVPRPYDTRKRHSIPEAMRIYRLHPGRDYCSLGKLAQDFGWKYGEIVSRLEEKRKSKGKEYYEKKQEAKKQDEARIKKVLSSDPTKAEQLAKIEAELKSLGHK